VAPQVRQHGDAGESADRDQHPKVVLSPTGQQYGQGAADQQRLGPRIGTEVVAVDVVGAEQEGTRERRGERAHAGDDQQRAAGAGREEREEGHHDQRPQQVELLLDPERPGVLQRRRGRRLGEVVGAAVDHAPVGHVSEGAERVPAQQPDFDRGEQPAEHDHDGDEHGQQSGQQPAGPAGPEGAEPDAPATDALDQEQRRDQVAGEHEERVNAEEPTRQPADAAVEEQYPGDCQGAHTIQSRPVGEGRAAFFGWPRVGWPIGDWCAHRLDHRWPA
jgi:hypothetical protein